MLLPLLLKEQTRPKKVNLEKSFLFQSLALLFYSFTTFICKLFFLRLENSESRVARWHIFKTKIPIWVNFGGSCNGRCWYIICLFCLFYGYLVNFVAIWYILWQFSIFKVIWYGSFPLFGCTKKNLATLRESQRDHLRRGKKSDDEEIFPLNSFGTPSPVSESNKKLMERNESPSLSLSPLSLSLPPLYLSPLSISPSLSLLRLCKSTAI
jgi:hypothetical protein